MKACNFAGILILVFLISSACSPTKNLSPTQSPDGIMLPAPTPTAILGSSPDLPAPTTASRCEGLEGVLELQLLIGPADAVGLEPVAVGDIPFSVVSIETPYIVKGESSISYENIMEEKWGTYSVEFDMDVHIEGECGGVNGAEQLMVAVEMAGDQLVEVQSEGFQGEYPWSGTHQLELAFPLTNGAEASGEGWQFILHINS